MTDQCLFCKIITGKIKSEKIFENEFVLAFKDINPQAPVHILIIPKKHLESVLEITEEDKNIIFEIVNSVNYLAKTYNIEDSGFRLVTNTGISAGQEIKHLHFHLLGGRNLGWPPG